MDSDIEISFDFVTNYFFNWFHFYLKKKIKKIIHSNVYGDKTIALQKKWTNFNVYFRTLSDYNAKNRHRKQWRKNFCLFFYLSKSNLRLFINNKQDSIIIYPRNVHKIILCITHINGRGSVFFLTCVNKNMMCVDCWIEGGWVWNEIYT